MSKLFRFRVLLKRRYHEASQLAAAHWYYDQGHLNLTSDLLFSSDSPAVPLCGGASTRCRLKHDRQSSGWVHTRHEGDRSGSPVFRAVDTGFHAPALIGKFRLAFLTPLLYL